MAHLSAQILNASDEPVGDGYIYKITSFEYTDRLDETGRFRLTLPYHDDFNVNTVPKGYRIVIYDDFVEIYRGIVESRERNNSTWTISGRDLLAELTWIESGINYQLNGTFLATVVQDVVALVAGWTATTPSVNSVRVIARFNGKPVFNTLLEAARMFGYHLRRTGARRLEVGAFGTSSGYTLANPARFSYGMHRNLLPITGFQVMENQDEIVNRLIVYGGSYQVNGETRVLYLSEVDIGTSDVVQHRERAGQTEYYLESPASIATYGVRERIQQFSDIRPPDDPAVTVLLDAQRALKSRAANYLQRFSSPQNAYSIESAVDEKPMLLVGDKVRVIYADEQTQIDNDFFVTEITHRYTGNQYLLHFAVSDIDRVILDAADLLLGGLWKLEEVRLKDL